MKKQIITVLLLTLAIGACTGCGSTQAAEATETAGATEVIGTAATEATRETSGTESAETTQEASETESTETAELTSYEDVLDLYVQQLSKKMKDPENWDSYEMPGVLVEIVFRYQENPLEGTVFTYQDLDGDGSEELLIGWTEDFLSIDNGDLLGVYSMKDGAPILTVEAWERYSCTLGSDAYLYTWGSGGAGYSTAQKCTYNIHKYDGQEYELPYDNFLEPVEELYSWRSTLSPDDDQWEYITDADLIGSVEYDSERHDELENKGLTLSNTEAAEIYKSWLSDGQELHYTTLADYTQEKGL